MINPEFQRNLWLEWNGHRVVFVCVVLACIFVLVSLFDPRGLGNGVARVALLMFAVLTMIWGGHRAGDALIEELRERTWDAQRMSALDPWTMTWGKLFGATVIPWFAGFICLVIYVVARTGPPLQERLLLALTFAAGAVLLQGLNLIGALIVTHQEKHGRSTLASWAAFGTLLLLAAYFAIYYRSDDAVYWFGAPYERLAFLALSVSVLAGWIVFGAYRLMCTELSVATTPWAWVLFVIYLTVYFAGHYIAPTWAVTRALAVFAAIGLIIAIAATYVAAFALYRDPLAFRRLASALSARRFFEALPVWMASLLLALPFALICIGMTFTSVETFTVADSLERPENVGLTAIAIVLETLRNLAILYYFTYSASPRRVESTTIIWIAVLTWLAPAIIETSGFVTASWILRPPIWDRPLLAAAILLAHAAIAIFACVQRYRAHFRPAPQSART